MAEEIKNGKDKEQEKEKSQDKKIVKASKKSPPAKGKDGKEKVKLGARIKNFFRDIKSELKRIVWPTRPQVIQNTGVVLVAIIIVAAIVGLLDLLFGTAGLKALNALADALK